MHKQIISAALLLCTARLAYADPSIIAHRGGTGDAPENTIVAISQSLKNNADAIWITVQMSKDGVLVLYRPSDLNSLTNLQGSVSSFTAAQLSKADAGYLFDKPTYPFRHKAIGIPTLEQVLKKWPQTFFYIDIKSPDADPDRLAQALAAVLQNTNSLSRTRVYSTDEKYIDALPNYIARFVSRDKTRTILANVTMSHHCEIDKNVTQERWYGLELKRDVEVVEKYTLGEGRSKSQLEWDEEAMKCFRSAGGAHIIFFGINTLDDYRKAAQLGADGVLVNSPAYFNKIKKN
ncbi:glycerophosphodiester phosphodiesterase [Obesumbacterium proteus]|nr:glycerophosphodiester phosphodiesterase [Obesumbacterium proteus]